MKGSMLICHLSALDRCLDCAAGTSDGGNARGMVDGAMMECEAAGYPIGTVQTPSVRNVTSTDGSTSEPNLITKIARNSSKAELGFCLPYRRVCSHLLCGSRERSNSQASVH